MSDLDDPWSYDPTHGLERTGVRSLIAECQVDSQRGTVFLVDETGHREDFSTQSDLQAALEDLADKRLYSEPGWDGNGTYMNHDGTWAYPPSRHFVADELSRSRLAAFFAMQQSVEEREVLFDSSSLFLNERLAIEISNVVDDLIRYLARHPKRLYELDPSGFEDVVAQLFRGQGYDVIQTPRTRDGGRDLLAYFKQPFGTILTIVECKRYSAHRHIGPALVRQLYGVLEKERVSHGMLATTTLFSTEARRIEFDLKYRLSLRDYNDIASRCREHASRTRP